jgi:adenylate kinase
MHNLIFMGPQGAGKGTQADRVSAQVGIPHVSLGQLFRAEIGRGTGLGREIASYVDKGEIVPIDLANQVMTERLSEDDASHGVILDGYPRTREQVDALDKVFAGLGRQVTHAFHINISDAVALKRLSGRRVCSNSLCERNYHIELLKPLKEGICDRCGGALIARKDDTPEAIKRRLEIYHRETKPLTELYKARGILHEIDGERPIDEVERTIIDILLSSKAGDR